MANGDQFQKGVEWAEEQMAGEGYKTADTNIVLYAGFGWLDKRNAEAQAAVAEKLDATAKEVNSQSSGIIRIKFEGKKVVFASGAAGLALGQLAAVILKFFGIDVPTV